MTLRELVVDAKGEIVKPEIPAKGPGAASAASKGRPGPPPELKPGESRKELEGVFLVREGKAVFVPVKVGIAGEKYFEVLSGLQAGDEVITGPFASVRNLREGDAVKVSTGLPSTATSGK